MALNSFFCADVPLRNYSLTGLCAPITEHVVFSKYLIVILSYERTGFLRDSCYYSSFVCQFYYLQ